MWLWGMSAVVLAFTWVVVRGAPYIPSHRRQVCRAFTELYPLSAKDTLVDLGSGDGVVLREAARFGATVIGYELNPPLVWLSRALSWRQGNVAVRLADMWRTQLPGDTTVVYAFSVSRDTKKLKKHLQIQATRLGRPLHLILYGHTLPEQQPIKQVGAHHLYVFEPLQDVKAQV